MASGTNLFEAYRILRAVEPERIENESIALRGQYWWAFGWSAYELGRYDEVDEISRQFRMLFEESGAASYEVYSSYLRALAREADTYLDPKPEALEAMREVSEGAEANTPIQFLALLALGKMTTGDLAWGYLERALESAEKQRSEYYVFRTRAEMARQMSRRNPADGYARLQQALAGFHRDPNQPWSIYGWEARLEVVWAALPREDAIDSSMDLLQEVEGWRRRQEEQGTGSLGFFSVWVKAYRRVIGYILDSDDPVSRGDLALAFGLSERMRARVFLDQLFGQGTTERACTDKALAGTGGALRREIVRLQRELMKPEANADRLRWRIENLLLDEEAIHRDGRCAAEQVDSAFAELEDLEEALDPDEALLVFHVGAWEDIRGAFDGGAWVFVVTDRGSSVHRLPDRFRIRLKRDAFVGALRHRDGREVTAATALYDDLLGSVEAHLRHPVQHLIVVPHGPVYSLPIAALRKAADHPPLVDRYRFSYVPSATLWRRWHHEEKAIRRQALAFANPKLDSTFAARLWPSVRGKSVGPLPRAEAEGRALLSSVEEKGRFLEGAEATE